MVRPLIALLIALAVVTTGCGRKAANDRAAPESAFRAFREALAVGNHERVASFLSEDDAATLGRWADAHAALGQTRPEPASLLRAAWVPWDEDIESLERLVTDDVGATLRLHFHNGTSADVRLVRVPAGGWTVDLDLPEPGAREGSAT